MKVLQVNVVYRKGSTGKITYDLHKGFLDAGIESVVCYGRGELVKEPGVYKTCPEWYSKMNNAWSRVTGIMYGGCFFSTNRLISIIKKEKPDIVHLQCINGYFVNIYRLVSWLKNNRIPTVLTLHAEFMHTANCGHAHDCDQWIEGCVKCKEYQKITHSLFFDRTACSYRKMKMGFAGFGKLTVVSVSPWLKSRAEKSAILRGMNHKVIFNGLDTDIFLYRAGIPAVIDSKGKKIALHVTADFADPMKGGQYVIDAAKRLPDVLFVVIGSYKDCENLPSNMVSMGRVSDQSELARYYSVADVTVLTSKRETFSMVAAESLSCGTPVVGFKAGGPEQISIPEFSEYCDYGDAKQLSKMILDWTNKNLDRCEISRRARNAYDKRKMRDQYLNIYNEMVPGGE